MENILKLGLMIVCASCKLSVKYHYQFDSLKPMPFFSQKTCPTSSTCSNLKLETEKGASVLPGVERYYRRHCRNRFQKSAETCLAGTTARRPVLPGERVSKYNPR